MIVLVMIIVMKSLCEAPGRTLSSGDMGCLWAAPGWGSDPAGPLGPPGWSKAGGSPWGWGAVSGLAGEPAGGAELDQLSGSKPQGASLPGCGPRGAMLFFLKVSLVSFLKASEGHVGKGT